MNTSRKTIVVSLMALFSIASASAFGASGDEAKAQGMIISRTGETLIVSDQGTKVTVVLTDDTVTKDDKGLFGLDKEHLSSIVLIPGLKIKVDGTSDDQGRIVAKTITTDGDDLESAEMIQAGLHPTAQQVSANVQRLSSHSQSIAANQQGIAGNQQGIASNQKFIATNQAGIERNMKDIDENTQRFTALSEYDVKAEATVKFNLGSSQISSADLEQLKQLAQTATGFTGYIIEVVGYADSSGSAVKNEKLSEDRAKRVVSYLYQQCNVPVRHIIAPAAMGEYQPTAANETKSGRAENRRVEIKVMVNKGIAGQ